MPLLSIPVFLDFVRYEKRLLARGGALIEMSLFRNSRFVLGVVAVLDGYGVGAITTMQTIGTSVGMAAVDILFFSLASPEVAVIPEFRATLYGHAFAFATVYNVVATLVSFTLFARHGRNVS